LLGSQFGRVTRRRVRPQRIRPFCFRDSQPPADRTFVNSEGGRDFDFQPPHAIQFNGSESPPFSNLSPNLLLVAHPLILKVALFMQLSSNYSSLGYGDIVMSTRWRLLGPLETIDGIVMFGISTALIFALLMRLIERRIKAMGQETDRMNQPSGDRK
jgi:hypothetical protein